METNHEKHCYQGDYTSCKYGDVNCPAKPVGIEAVHPTPWRVEQMQVHGLEIRDAKGGQVVHDIYTEEAADLIVRAVNAYAAFEAIRARHDERAKSLNFPRCGCDYCKAMSGL